MTTIIDPTGTPTIVYNRSGTTIITMDGGTTSNPGSPIGNEGVDIPRFSEITSLLSSGTGNDVVFRLPADSEIGDVVEVYFMGSGRQTPAVFPQVGDQILPVAVVSTGTNTSARGGTTSSSCSYRKVASDTWVTLGPSA